MCQRLVCQKREFAVIPVKFNDPKFKNEIFVRIDMKHSYFSNYFMIYLQSIFSVVGTDCCFLSKIISCLAMHNICSCCIKASVIDEAHAVVKWLVYSL